MRVVDFARYIYYWLRVRNCTMVSAYNYAINLLLVKKAVGKESLRLGAIVECGTWRGGMSAGLMKVGGPSRAFLFCDSFAGLPSPEAIDGEAALLWAKNPTGPRYFNNCRAERAEFVRTMTRAGFGEPKYRIVEGFYANSLADLEVPPVAVLRLDCDWYSSTRQCLEKFWPRVLPGGLVILDDYYDWVGCRRAVYEYFATRGLGEALRRPAGAGFAYLWKSDREPADI